MDLSKTDPWRSRESIAMEAGGRLLLPLLRAQGAGRGDRDELRNRLLVLAYLKSLRWTS